MSNTSSLSTIHSPNVYPTSPAGFAQAVKDGRWLITSGQVGWDRDMRLTEDGGFEAQLGQAFRNVEALIKEAGSDLSQVWMLRFYVKQLDEHKRQAISQCLQAHYKGAYRPASSLIGVQALARKELLIEIECIANISST